VCTRLNTGGEHRNNRNRKHLHQITGPAFKNVTAIAEHLCVKSHQIVTRAVEKWRSALTGEKTELLDLYSKGSIHPECKDSFTVLRLSPSLGECSGVLLECEELIVVGPNSALGKDMYKCCVKTFNKTFLNNKCDTPWRKVLNLDVNEKPEWRVLYKSPLVKKTEDLQWRLLHGAIPVNAFISLINDDVTEACPFCSQKETIFHAYLHCDRLQLLFNILDMFFYFF